MNAALDSAELMAVLGYRLVPIPPGEKYPKGLRAWQNEATSDASTIQRWLADTDNGIGWVMGTQDNNKRLIGIDVDVNDGKQGKANLEALIRQWGPEVKAAFTSTVTARTGTGGYHFIFELPDDAPLLTNGKLCEHVDTRGEGGFLMAAPTIHPNGQPYRWVDGKEPWTIEPRLAPASLIEALARVDAVPDTIADLPGFSIINLDDHRDSGDTPADWARANLSINNMLFAAGWTQTDIHGTDVSWCRPGKAPRDGNSAVVHDDEHLVVWSTNAPAEFWRCGRDNKDGSRSLSPIQVFAAIEHHGDVSRASSDIRRNKMPRREPVAPARSEGSTVEAQPGGTGASASSLNLPDEFWESRDWLTHIRNAAWHRQISPDAILGAVIARFAAVVPPNYQIPAIVGAPATFDHLSVLVAESAGGKSAAMAVARELFPGPQQRADIVWDYPTPTGEGLVGAFFEMVPEEDSSGKKQLVNKKTKTAVHFSVDEGLGLVEASGRQGATIGSVLCTAWSGGNPGQGNASAERKRVGMNPWTYRMAGLAAIQLSLGHRLMDDVFVQQGLSGRLVFFAAEDPSIPHWTERPEWPGPLKLEVPATIPLTIEYDPSIQAEVLEQNYQKQTKRIHVAPIDGHLNLVRLKLSGIFALMESRTTVTESDWRIAGLLLHSHIALRSAMLELKKQHAYERSVTAATAAAHFETTRDEVKERQLLARLRDAIIAKVPEEGITRGQLRKKVTSSSTRHRFDEALERAAQDGKIEDRDGVIHRL